MKLSEIAKEIHAQLYGPDGKLPPIVIDSRKIQAADMFVALKGENHDGHDFIASSIENGASVVLAARAPQTDKEKSITFLQVKDTTIALGEIASIFRRLYPIPMVGLTGSCGKTTVKGMIESICQQQGKTLATKGNFNNHIGLPLTLIRLDASYQYAVIEMGASALGEIQYLGGIARPNITLITNIRPAHLLGFGSIENVASAKGEIYEILPKDGTAILNVDEPFSESWLGLIKDKKVITFGIKKPADVTARNIELQAFSVTFTLHIKDKSARVCINTPGEHTVMNVLAAASAGYALGISLERIVKGLESFQGVEGRLRRFKGLQDAWIIDDSYNANPGSVNAALDVLAHCEGKRIFVMGDMAELGENAIEYHTQVGNKARQQGIERLLAVGKLTEHAVKAFGEGAMFYPDKEALVNDLKSTLNSQTVILVKGSRSAKMEVVTKALTAREEA
ncbi:MAG: UDP-N-acetylmuramoyl-tripeptide--D-alanyl-D-alanine ligase [Proteobacteria bacterium]|nr:UDP-N-acetylmuramoyl-tripeptide--D-alanyl-D-alanine ligase [Pseudomonadota bacterium]